MTSRPCPARTSGKNTAENEEWVDSPWRIDPYRVRCKTRREPARDAAGDLDLRIGGGPTVVRDFLVADLIEMLTSCGCRSCSAAAFACGMASRQPRTATTSRRSRHRAA
jgi:hypothetical protein